MTLEMPSLERDAPIRKSPQLLVSVRNAEEARAASAGGCELIDVKEPSRGSLGMADEMAISGVIEFAIHEQIGLPISCALGEVLDWTGSIPSISSEVSFVKLGLAGLGTQQNWETVWRSTRMAFNQSSGYNLNWIAVAYADWRLARAPAPSEIVDAIRKTQVEEDRCVGVLVDTFSKSEKRLFDWFGVDELSEFLQSVRQLGLLTAVAGRLSVAEIPNLARVQPDIIAIRSAACLNSERNAAVSEIAVRHFRNAVREEFETVGQSTQNR